MPGCAIFERVFWAFGPSIEGFQHYRPAICIDGTFLYGKYRGTLLIALTWDCENRLFPLAFAIMESIGFCVVFKLMSLIRKGYVSHLIVTLV